MKIQSIAANEALDLRLPNDDMRLLVRFLFYDGWVNSRQLVELAPLWNPRATFAEIECARETFTKIWLKSNAAFKGLADQAAEIAGRPLSEDERLKLEFPHGPYYNEAQQMLDQWFAHEMENAILVN